MREYVKTAEHRAKARGKAEKSTGALCTTVQVERTTQKGLNNKGEMSCSKRKRTNSSAIQEQQAT